MIKVIFKQIINRKKSNIWIAVELFLVFIIIWYMVDYFFVLGYNYNIPSHRDIRHSWQLIIDEYPESCAEYREGESTKEAKEANFDRLLKTIHDYPEVEAVTVSFAGSRPESGDYIGDDFRREDDSINLVHAQMIFSDPREDFFKVFAYTANEGKKPVSIQDFKLSNINNDVVVSRSIVEALFPEGSPIGKDIYQGMTKYTIIGVVDDIKRFAFLRPHHAIYIFQHFNAGMLRDTKISIRSKASVPDNSFKERFKKELQEHLQAGNFYLKNISTYAKAAEEIERQVGVKKQVIERVYMMIFFLLNILLCVMGTFWYRIYTRREEIGIRKAMGASSANIRNILLTEGLILLTIAAIPAIILEFNFVYAELIDTFGKNGSIKEIVYLPDRTYLRFLITNVITWIVMAVVIVTAIWLPARKAAALAPADALHYE
jgi:ABC-type antimicrobial peptide transport system permease subunit